MATRAISLDDGSVPLFEEEWPELARRLDRFLATKGIDHWLRGDVVQETATRLYPRWVTLDHSRPLWNLVLTIALRIVQNHRRKDARIELVEHPVPLFRDDVDLRGVQRVQLGKTGSALQRLTPDQRRVLLAEVGEASLPEGTSNRVNVLRLRARARLKEVLGPWAPAGVVLRMRSIRTGLERRALGWGQHAGGLAASITNVAMAATLLLAGTGVEGTTASPRALAIEQGSDPIGITKLGGFDGGLPSKDVFHFRQPKSGPTANNESTDQSNEAGAPVTDPLKPAREKWDQARGTYNDARKRTFDTFHRKYNTTRKSVVRRGQETWRRTQDLAGSYID